MFKSSNKRSRALFNAAARSALPPQLTVEYLEMTRGAIDFNRPGIPIVACLPSVHIAPSYGRAHHGRPGTVAAITKDTDQVPILVVRHADNILTVYANIDGIKVAKGETVKRGQTIAEVRAGSPAFLHFEVRNGIDAVDPMPYLQ